MRESELRYVSLAQLAAEHEISVSHLQKLFNDNLA